MMCCYYPTTTIAIDDDINFLNILTKHLKISDCTAYSSPNEAIELLHKVQKPIDRIKSRIFKKTNVTLEDVNLCPEDHAVVINMRGLHEEIYNHHRFSDVSVIIVDYYMKDINGIDICETLAEHPAKKILLTGGQDKEKVAIEAFNKGIIHSFISKSDPNFPIKLIQAVSLLKEAYFRDLTSTLLSSTTILVNSLYHYPFYKNFIQNIQNQFNTVEYYAFDMLGSLLMLNAEGRPTWFILKHESEIQDYKQLAHDQDAPVTLINGLEKRTLLPFFFSDEDYQQPAHQWGEYFYEAKPLPGITDYYYALVNNLINNTIDYKRVSSYKN